MTPAPLDVESHQQQGYAVLRGVLDAAVPAHDPSQPPLPPDAPVGREGHVEADLWFLDMSLAVPCRWLLAT